MHISAVEPPIHTDLYSVSGTDIPADAVFEFSTAVGPVRATPDFVRPHLAFLFSLPPSIPVGTASVKLTSLSAPASNSISVNVAAAPLRRIHVIQPGEAKDRPYTVAFVGNPAIESAAGNVFTADPVLTNRPVWQRLLAHCLQNLFGVAEDLLRRGNIESRLRIVAVFDPTLSPTSANALVHEIPGSNTMETRRNVLAAFLATFGVQADMVFAIHGSTTHTRASAWFTTDDNALGGTPYTLDGTLRTHGHFPRIPGSAALPLSLDTNGLTVIHEFAHAASDFTNGKVVDLYNDGGDGQGLLINKRFRAASGNPVPSTFALYNGMTFSADAARDGLGYPASWRSYHAAPIDPTRPNLMDNYWLSPDDPQLCRLDQMTSAWFADRLNAKLGR